MEVLTYAPSSVVLLISGYQIKGWTGIKITRNSVSFKQIRGIRGKNTRTRLKDSSSTLTIRTFQTELLNEVLSKCLEADEQLGAVRLEIVLKELTGTTFYSTTTAYITGYPEVSYENGISEVTWTLVSDDSQLSIGSARNAAVGIVENGIARLKDFVSDI